MNKKLEEIKKLVPDFVFPGIILIFIATYTHLNYLWLTLSKKPPYAGGVVFSLKSLEYFQNLQKGDWFSFLVSPGNYYPPLCYQATAMFFKIFKPSHTWAALSQFPFLIIMALSTYLLAKHLWNEKVGIWAGLLSISLPGVAFYTRLANVDLQMASFVPLLFYLLFKSDDFKNTKYSILFALAFSLGMLAKWSILIYVAVPVVLYIAWPMIKKLKNKETRKNALITTAIIAGLAIISAALSILFYKSPRFNDNPDILEISYIIYVGVIAALLAVLFIKFKNIGPFFKNVTGFVLIYLFTNAHFLLFHAAQFPEVYRTWFWKIQHRLLLPNRNPYSFFVEFLTIKYLGVFFLVFVLAGIVYFYIKERQNRHAFIIPVSIAVSLVLMLMQPIYEPRYFLPFSGLVSIFAVFWIFRIKIRPIRTTLFVTLAFFIFIYSMGWSVLPAKSVESLSKISIINGYPQTKINRIKGASKRLITAHRKGKKADKTLVIFHDGAHTGEMTPILWFYRVRLLLNKKEDASLIYPGIDPIFPLQGKPWGILIYPRPEEDDETEGYSKYAWQQTPDRQGEKGDIDLKNRLEGASIGRVENAGVIVCRFRNTEKKQNPKVNDNRPAVLKKLEENASRNIKPGIEKTQNGKKGFPADVINALNMDMQRRYRGMKYMWGFEVLDGVIMDVYEVDFS